MWYMSGVPSVFDGKMCTLDRAYLCGVPHVVD